MFRSPTTLSPSSQISPVRAFAATPLSSSKALTLHVPPLSPFSATLTDCPQLHENTGALSPVFATLTDCVKHKSFVCHSYKKHGGWGPSTHQSLNRPCVSPIQRLAERRLVSFALPA